MNPKRTNSLVVVGVFNCFFYTTAAASTIGYVCQVCSEVQKARTWRQIPMGAVLVQPRCSLRWSEAEPTISSDTILFEAVKGHWTQEGCEGPLDIRGQTVFRLSAYVDLQPLDLIGSEEKSDSPFVSTLRPPSRISPTMQVFQ